MWTLKPAVKQRFELGSIDEPGGSESLCVTWGHLDCGTNCWIGIDFDVFTEILGDDCRLGGPHL